MIVVHRFVVRAAATAQTLPRMINHFAQRNLMPSAIVSRIEQEGMVIVIVQSGLLPGRAAIIAEKMREEVLAESVILSADS